MTISTVLVASRDRACGGAVALARQGLEVTLVDGFKDWSDVGVALDEGCSDPPTTAQLRDAGVEVRTGVELIGFVAVDRHVEAELSDGRIENHDAIVLCAPGTVRVIAEPDAVETISRALADG